MLNALELPVTRGLVRPLLLSLIAHGVILLWGEQLLGGGVTTGAPHVLQVSWVTPQPTDLRAVTAEAGMGRLQNDVVPNAALRTNAWKNKAPTHLIGPAMIAQGPGHAGGGGSEIVVEPLRRDNSTGVPAVAADGGARFGEQAHAQDVIDGNDLRALRMQMAGLAARNRIYPAAAQERGLVGVVEVRIAFSQAGISALSVQRSSGHSQLDRAAVAMLEEASQRAVLPGRLRGISFQIVLPVTFVPEKKSGSVD